MARQLALLPPNNFAVFETSAGNSVTVQGAGKLALVMLSSALFSERDCFFFLTFENYVQSPQSKNKTTARQFFISLVFRTRLVFYVMRPVPRAGKCVNVRKTFNE